MRTTTRRAIRAFTTAAWPEAAGTDFDLYLYKWNGARWVIVAQSDGATAKEEISYTGSAGYYYWRVTAYSGGGAYTFSYTRPN